MFCISKKFFSLIATLFVIILTGIVFFNLNSTKTIGSKAAIMPCYSLGGSFYGGTTCPSNRPQITNVSVPTGFICCKKVSQVSPTPTSGGRTCSAMGGRWFNKASYTSCSAVGAGYTNAPQTASDQSYWINYNCCIQNNPTPTRGSCTSTGGRCYSNTVYTSCSAVGQNYYQTSGLCNSGLICCKLSTPITPTPAPCSVVNGSLCITNCPSGYYSNTFYRCGEAGLKCCIKSQPTPTARPSYYPTYSPTRTPTPRTPTPTRTPTPS